MGNVELWNKTLCEIIYNTSFHPWNIFPNIQTKPAGQGAYFSSSVSFVSVETLSLSSAWKLQPKE